MKKFVLSLLTLFISVSFIVAQKGDLLVKNGDKGLFLEHKVVAKESFFSVGRLYNVHPKFIASFNNLDMGKGLQIDQKLRIPLTDTNFTQKGNSGTPVYYKADVNEGLMKISKANNDVKLANLRAWNNLTGDNAGDKKKLIVGFLLSKEMPTITIGTSPKTKEPTVKKEEKPVVAEPTVEDKPVVKNEEPVVKKEEKPVVTEPKVDDKPVVKTEEKTIPGGQGYFRSHFEQQIRKSPITKDETVTAGIFKTTSGWREFIRIVYEREGIKQRTTNYWGFTRKIPSSFWTGETGIHPIDRVIKKALKTGYSHHIERLMVVGNFMLLCEFDPDEVYRWFMEMYVDSYDWVMVPNVYGMTQFADGGLMTTKPYISSSNYLLKMGDWNKGPWQEIWDGLFWRFMHVHRDFFLKNPRLGMLIKIFDKMPVEKRNTHLKNAAQYLESLTDESKEKS